MNVKIDPNATIYPTEANTENGTCGLTKREWFAGQALAGLCACDADSWGGDDGDITPGEHARLAVLMADALVEALSREEGS